jgi:hypothetical protein
VQDAYKLDRGKESNKKPNKQHIELETNPNQSETACQIHPIAQNEQSDTGLEPISTVFALPLPIRKSVSSEATNQNWCSLSLHSINEKRHLTLTSSTCGGSSIGFPFLAKKSWVRASKMSANNGL